MLGETTNLLVLVIGLIIGLGLYFAPSALAIVRGNVFKGQVIKLQIILLVLTLVVGAVVSVVGFLGVSTEKSAGRADMMGQVAVPDDALTPETEEVEVEAAAPASTSGSRILFMLCLIGGGIWAFIAIILWFYILLHALRDQQMFLLSRFGINF